MKKYTYQAKNFNEAKNLAMTELMEQEENLYIKEIESSTKLFNKKSVIEVIKKDDVVEGIKDLIKDIVSEMGLTLNMEVKKRDEESLKYQRANREKINQYLRDKPKASQRKDKEWKTK